MISSLYKKHSITFFYLMLLLVFSHSFISAQTPDMPFNIYLKQASLKEFTAKIEQLSEYSFIYGEEVVLKHPITLDLKETPLTTILQTAFIKQDISFEITKHHIILKKTTSLPIKQHFTLNGYVLDEISKETLIGANIYDQQNKQKSHYIKKIRSTIQQEVFYPKRVCIGQYIERNIDRCQYL